MKNRIVYYDALNVFAMLAVLFLHFSTISHWYFEGRLYVLSLFNECFFYFAVPVFYMLTGATLFGYRERYDTKTFFKKRVTRTFVPFLLWSLIMLCFQVSQGAMDWPQGPRTLINDIFNNRIMQVYWFFFPLFMMYLAMPVFSCMTSEKFRRPLWYAVGVGVLTTAVLPPVCALVGLEYPGTLVFPLFSGLLLYPVLGYLASTTDFTKRQRTAVYAAGLVAVTIRFFTILLSRGAANEGSAEFSYLWTYTGFAGFFPGLAIFVFFKQVDWHRLFPTPQATKALATVSSCSFGIYLIHMAFVQWAQNTYSAIQYSVAWVVLGPICCYLLCLAIVWLVKKVPVVGRVFP